MLTPIAKGMLAVSVIFPVLAGILVALRFTARRVKNVRAQADDWMIVLAEVGIRQVVNTILLTMRRSGVLHWTRYQYHNRGFLGSRWCPSQ